MLVNRVRGEVPNLGKEIAGQLAGSPTTLRTAGAGALVVALIPGMPKIPFIGLSAGLFFLANRLKASMADAPATSDLDVSVTTDPDDPEVLMARMRTEPLELRLAYDVTDLVAAGDLLPRIRELRRQLATELGFVLPHVITTEDASLPSGGYRIAVWGVDVGTGRVPSGCVLALPDPSMQDEMQLAVVGERVIEPVFGLVGYWIPEEERGAAAASGATLVPRSAAIVTHVAELARRYAPDLLSRQHVADLVESLRSDQPLLANEIGNDRIPMTTLHQVLRSLLAERVAIRDLPRIVETLSVAAGDSRTPDALADECRAVLGAQIAAAVAPNQTVAAVLLVPELEGRLMTAFARRRRHDAPGARPRTARRHPQRGAHRVGTAGRNRSGGAGVRSGTAPTARPVALIGRDRPPGVRLPRTASTPHGVGDRGRRRLTGRLRVRLCHWSAGSWPPKPVAKRSGEAAGVRGSGWRWVRRSGWHWVERSEPLGT